MNKLLLVCFLAILSSGSNAQSITQIKKILDTTSNPVGFVKFVLKKKFYIDTVAVLSTANFLGKADSLAYHGKVGKTYGPFKHENILVKVLVKAPNTFYHVKHILLDTSLYTVAFAEKLADTILASINEKRSSFTSMASTYSADYSSSTNSGDLGWFVKGVMLPEMEYKIGKAKKGEIFKVWTSAGLHIVQIADNPKQDTGYALLLRIIL